MINRLSWTKACEQLAERGEAYVLVTVIADSGSTPRAAGTKMVIGGDQCYDTIGGGHLEFKVIERARSLLLQPQPQQLIEHFPLAASLGQCCGGSATVLLESFTETGLKLLLFGAGHVSRALVDILAGLPIRVSWIDNREELTPALLSDNTSYCYNDDPVHVVQTMTAGSTVLIMTHNHHLDYQLVEAALQHDHCRWLGVIGSNTKAQRFRQRLQNRGFSNSDIARMHCPVGVPQVSGKRPMEVAVSIAAQLIALYQTAPSSGSQSSNSDNKRQLSWRQIKQLLVQESIS